MTDRAAATDLISAALWARNPKDIVVLAARGGNRNRVGWRLAASALGFPFGKVGRVLVPLPGRK